MEKVEVFKLKALGWSAFFERQLAGRPQDGWIPARVAEEHQHLYTVFTQYGSLISEISGRLRYGADTRDDFPAVGDWVLVQPRHEESRATIREILTRRSKFSRKSAGAETTEQIVAANIDRVFLVQSANQDFNTRRLERYLTLIWESGANPIVLINKIDLCPNPTALLAEATLSAPGVPIHAVSALTGEGLKSIVAYLDEGITIALLGSSGVGKSTIVNSLAGSDLLKVQAIREADGRGRHTTASRQLILLAQGGILIDTPGMRELQLWDGDSGLSRTFEDIEKLSTRCQFRDCGHSSEPQCAVRAALDSGLLPVERWENYEKLRAELRHLGRKRDIRVMLDEKRKWKQIHKQMRRRYRQGKRGPI